MVDHDWLGRNLNQVDTANIFKIQVGNVVFNRIVGDEIYAHFQTLYWQSDISIKLIQWFTTATEFFLVEKYPKKIPKSIKTRSCENWKSNIINRDDFSVSSAQTEWTLKCLLPQRHVTTFHENPLFCREIFPIFRLIE